MRKTLIISLCLAVASSLYGQTADVAVLLSQEQTEGSARTMAMGNAFTALGGDIGAVSINPAGSAVLRRSEFSITPSLDISREKATYLGTQTTDGRTRFGVSNAGFIFNFDTGAYEGLLNFNFGFTYNTKNNFNAQMSATGETHASGALSATASNLTYYGIPCSQLDQGISTYYNTGIAWPEILAWNAYLIATADEFTDNEYISSTENIKNGYIFIPGDLQQRAVLSTFGSTNEFAINFGANISDKLFLGANINLMSTNYSVDNTYRESSFDYTLFDDKFVSMDQTSWVRTGGAGIGIKLGAIATPVAGLRIGATFTTPTWYRMTDTWGYQMISEFGNGKRWNKETPQGEMVYNLTTPLRFSLGAAYVFGKTLILSADYERVDYSTAKMKARSIASQADIDIQNDIIKSNSLASNIIRVGIEAKPTERLSIRAGYNSLGAASYGGQNISLISGGVGFRLTANSSLDIAYQHKLNTDNEFVLYTYLDPSSELSAPAGVRSSGKSKVMFTWSIKL